MTAKLKPQTDVSGAGETRPLSKPLETGKPAPAKSSGGASHESSDTYARIVCVITPGWRVIEGACSMQWILQTKAVGYTQDRKPLSHVIARRLFSQFWSGTAPPHLQSFFADSIFGHRFLFAPGEM